ncbi:NAD(P)-dependent oxidoreductase [Qipengyuania sp. DGS5-3]|uniref:NAD(P)-dependent oxidoreductase n=1 Tax=Qipengyuania sp. DGS5-3 TaxID=3349632 RepID=UPI0036D254F0
MTETLSIAFLGLGVMGSPMARHLLSAGHRVTVYNRTASKAEAWLESTANERAVSASTPAEAAAGQDIVISCVGNDQDLAEVLFGENGALDAMTPSSLLIDHTTVSAGMARRVDEAAAMLDIGALDAPVSGGQAGAENGALAIMCGGSEKAMSRAKPVMQAYGKTIIHVGAAGAGQTAKMANQMCIAGVLGGLSEAIRLTQAAGLDTDRTLQAISGGAAQSWQMENRWPTMVEGEFDFGFAIDWMRKDLGYALDEARRLGLSAPVTEMVDKFYAELQEAGAGRQDTSALIKRLPKGNP